MAKKETVHPWQKIEEQAFHAFREWPVWLVLRKRELAKRITQSEPHKASTTTDNPAPQQSKGN